MFPVEIWEKILKNIDAADLVRLRIVSSTWNEIIKKHLQESDAWHKQCIQHVPREYWPLLLENSFHSTTWKRNAHDKQCIDYKICLTIYRTWLKWSNVENLNALTIVKFQPMPEHRPTEQLTCCATLGELLALGSTEGYIRIFNLKSNKLVFRVDQYVQVLDVKFSVQGKSSDKIVLIATLVNNKSRVWDISSQKSLMATTGDVTCAGYGYYCTTLCHDKILVYDAVNENSIPVRLFIKDCNMNARRYSDTRIKYVGMTINQQQELAFLTDTGLYCQLSLQELKKESPHKTLYTPQVTYIGVPKNQRVYRYYLYNPRVSFCLTDKGHLGVSVDKSKWQFYNVYPFLGGKITTLKFHARVLLLGLDSGIVCIYLVENVSKLQDFNFKSAKSKRICVASEPIVCLSIMEIDGDSRLLAATKSTVYHIELQC